MNFKNKLSFILWNIKISKTFWGHKSPYNSYALLIHKKKIFFITRTQSYFIDTNSQITVKRFFSSSKLWNIVSPKKHKILNNTWAVFIWIFSNPILYQYKPQEIWKMLSLSLSALQRDKTLNNNKLHGVMKVHHIGKYNIFKYTCTLKYGYFNI